MNNHLGRAQRFLVCALSSLLVLLALPTVSASASKASSVQAATSLTARARLYSTDLILRARSLPGHRLSVTVTLGSEWHCALAATRSGKSTRFTLPKNGSTRTAVLTLPAAGTYAIRGTINPLMGDMFVRYNLPIRVR